MHNVAPMLSSLSRMKSIIRIVNLKGSAYICMMQINPILCYWFELFRLKYMHTIMSAFSTTPDDTGALLSNALSAIIKKESASHVPLCMDFLRVCWKTETTVETHSSEVWNRPRKYIHESNGVYSSWWFTKHGHFLIFLRMHATLAVLDLVRVWWVSAAISSREGYSVATAILWIHVQLYSVCMLCILISYFQCICIIYHRQVDSKITLCRLDNTLLRLCICTYKTYCDVNLIE